jgi:hypothetical protein
MCLYSSSRLLELLFGEIISPRSWESWPLLPIWLDLLNHSEKPIDCIVVRHGSKVIPRMPMDRNPIISDDNADAKAYHRFLTSSTSSKNPGFGVLQDPYMNNAPTSWGE